MKKNSTFLKFLVIIVCLFTGFNSFAQMSIAPNVSVVCVSQPTNYVTASVSAPPSGVASYSWSILPSNCGLVINTSAGTATVNISCAGNYTISCVAYNSSNVALDTATTLVLAANNPAPLVNITPNNGVGCINTTFTVSYSNNLSYTSNIPGFTVTSQSFPWTLTATACYSVIGTNSLNCTNSSQLCFSVIPSPTITIVPSSTALCLGQTATLIASGANTYSWNNSNTSNINVITPSASTLGIVSGTAANGCTVTAAQLIVVNPVPTVNVFSPITTVCAGNSTTLTATGATSYTWNTGQTGNPIVVSPSVSTCYSVLGAYITGCGQVAGLCVNVNQGPVLNIAGVNTVCLGSSATYTATGGLTYTWSNSSNGSTVNILPSISGTVGVASTGANGCVSSLATNLFVDTNCSDVWPGDANSDGNVTSADVFEIGLAFNSTGTPRSPGGNTYVAQYATNWSGTVSTNKNLCHADCNGDGTINSGDTVAISNNFALVHSFKPSGAGAPNPDISLVPQFFAFPGYWAHADVVVGTPTSNLSQVYGISFEIDFDVNLIDDAYMVFSPSFLNSSNQNIEFRKLFATNGKLVAVSVRTNKNDVSGNGKIGTFHYKIKASPLPPAGTPVITSISNAQVISSTGVINPLVGGSSNEPVQYPVGLDKHAVPLIYQVFPSPVTNQLSIRTASNEQATYVMSDLSGRVVQSGSFTEETSINVSGLSSGVYFVEVKTVAGAFTQKVIVDHK